MEEQPYDVIVVGAGNAALCAALAARENNAKVLVLERAPQAQRGGNSAYTGGVFRTVFNGAEDIKKLAVDLTEAEIASSDFGSYSAEQYLDDFGRITQYHCDPDLVEVLVRQSLATLHWLRDKGVRFHPAYGIQAVRHEGRFKFFGDIVIAAAHGGRGLVEDQFRIAEKQGIEIRYDTRAVGLQVGKSGIEAVRVIANGVEEDIPARTVVLAAGGFEANREWRTRYLGQGWEMAKVRGTRYNTGDGIQMALNIGAQSHGHWSGCHGISWERYAPDFGDVDVGNEGDRDSYVYGIMVNTEGKRFLDEAADFRTYTYSKYGRIILQQPGSCAWQVFDAQAVPYQDPEYRHRNVTRVRANTLEELADKMEGINREQFLQTVREYNAAIKRDVPFNPSIKDGRGTVGLALNKSNWATALEEPPFDAYAVGVGITFTYGGVKIDTDARVLDVADAPIPGLYAAGEMVGGLFYFNYPGASGLMAGSVFGKIAGDQAAAHALRCAA